MYRGKAVHRIFYAAGVLCVMIAAFGLSQLALISVLLLFIGACFHLRWHRGDQAVRARQGANPTDARLISRPGLRDRYEGIDTSLTHRPE